jgi:hypothetical protein
LLWKPATFLVYLKLRKVLINIEVGKLNTVVKSQQDNYCCTAQSQVLTRMKMAVLLFWNVTSCRTALKGGNIFTRKAVEDKIRVMWIASQLQDTERKSAKSF